MKKLLISIPFIFLSLSSFAALNTIGGTSADYDEFPFQVGLYTVRGEYFCSGALVESNWVVTAAHCMPAWSGANWIVVGLHDKKDLRGAEFFKSKRAIVHPGYNKITKDNDLALIELTGHSYRKPIQLGSAEHFLYEGSRENMVWSTGWDSSANASSVLQKVELPFVSKVICNSQFGYGDRITSNMICAGFDRGKVGPCDGDNGGPLFAKAPNHGGYSLVGIVSWPLGCHRYGKYSVFTKVGNYVDWIKQRISED